MKVLILQGRIRNDRPRWCLPGNGPATLLAAPRTMFPDETSVNNQRRTVLKS